MIVSLFERVPSFLLHGHNSLLLRPRLFLFFYSFLFSPFLFFFLLCFSTLSLHSTPSSPIPLLLSSLLYSSAPTFLASLLFRILTLSIINNTSPRTYQQWTQSRTPLRSSSWRPNTMTCCRSSRASGTVLSTEQRSAFPMPSSWPCSSVAPSKQLPL